MNKIFRNKFIPAGILLLSFLIVSLGIQAQTVNGRVTDSYENPLSGVEVYTEHGNVGTTTDYLGNFTLNLDDLSFDNSEGAVLHFEKFGYFDLQKKVVDDSKIQVALEKDIHHQDEEIDLGWESIQRKNLVAAISTVKGREFEKSPVANLSLGFAGRFPGLATIETSSEPSRANTSFYIRGFSTARGAQPLVVIDGIMIPNSPIQTLDFISPEEIESVEILKDGVSQSMFGGLGGNGVMLVNTKKGRKGPLRITTKLQHSIQQVTTSPTMMSSFDYATLRQQAWANDFSGNSNYEPLFTEDDLNEFKLDTNYLYPNNNWYNEYFKKVTSMQRIGLNATAGNDKVQFYSNLNFMLQNGLFKTDQTDYHPNSRDIWANFRSNVNIKITKDLTGFVNISGNIKREHTPSAGAAGSGGEVAAIYASIFHLPPTMFGPLTPNEVDPETGQESPESRQVITSGDERSPTYGLLNRTGYHNHTVTNIFTHFGLTADLGFLTKGLSATGVFAFQTNTVNSLRVDQDYRRMKRNEDDLNELIFDPVYSNENTTLSYSKGSSLYYNLSYQGKLNYERSFGKHSISAVGYAFYQHLMDAGNWYPFNRFSSGLEVTYDYDGRYLVMLNSGYSGTGQFARDHRYVFTPGVGLGWSFKNETFLGDADWLSEGKVRASWAQTANDQDGQGRYSYLDDIRSGRGGSIAFLQYLVSENHFGNPAYEAEKIKKRNIGIDLGLFNMVTISADLFDERTDNMMASSNTTVPLIQGRPLGSLPNLNIGSFKNQGYEVSVAVHKRLNKDWEMGLGGFITKTKNRVLFNGEQERDEDYAFPFRSQGFAIGQQFGYLIDYHNGNGYINTQEEFDNSPEYERQKRFGDFLYYDMNGDGIVDDKDRIPLGTGSLPNYYYGFNGEVSYKSFQLSFMFQGIEDFYRITQGWGVQDYHFEGVYSDLHRNAWTAERFEAGDKITYAALSTNITASDEGNSFYVFDKSYLRLKNVELSYTLPDSFTRRIGAQNVRVLFSGQNLLNWDHMKTSDFGPEGNGFGAIPVYKVYNFGIDLTF